MFICIALMIILCTVIPTAVSDFQDTLNVGTVLFFNTDADKVCWTRESVSLLRSRLIMQELVPKTLRNTRNDNYIKAFINYINACLDVIRTTTSGTSQQLMVLALADTVGGYLKSYLLPVTKKAYYAGNIRYEEAKKLFSLYDEIKATLRTNGMNWNKEINLMNKKVKVSPLTITAPPKYVDACTDFITYEKVPKPWDKNGQSTTNVAIPIPFLDDNKSPHSIAVPLKTFTLHSLDAPSSKYLIVKYYIAGTKCLLSRSVPKEDILHFNMEFQRFLRHAVLPHLRDEKWYPAFGGVMKILETMKKLKLETDEETGDYEDETARNNVFVHTEASAYRHLVTFRPNRTQVKPTSLSRIHTTGAQEGEEKSQALVQDTVKSAGSYDEEEEHRSLGKVHNYLKNENEKRTKLKGEIVDDDSSDDKGGPSYYTFTTTGYILVTVLAVMLVWICAGIISLVLFMCRKKLVPCCGARGCLIEEERGGGGTNNFPQFFCPGAPPGMQEQYGMPPDSFSAAYSAPSFAANSARSCVPCCSSAYQQRTKVVPTKSKTEQPRVPCEINIGCYMMEPPKPLDQFTKPRVTIRNPPEQTHSHSCGCMSNSKLGLCACGQGPDYCDCSPSSSTMLAGSQKGRNDAPIKVRTDASDLCDYQTQKGRKKGLWKKKPRRCHNKVQWPSSKNVGPQHGVIAACTCHSTGEKKSTDNLASSSSCECFSTSMGPAAPRYS